jgi:hypothetical protein
VATKAASNAGTRTRAPRRSSAETDQAKAIQDALERSLNSRRIVALLTEKLGFSDEAVASMTSVHEGSVRRWRSKDPDVGDPRPPQAKAIERIRAIALHFVEYEALRDLRGVGAWFEQINPGLDDGVGMEAPADAFMDAERFEAVMALARRFTMPGAGMAAYGPPGYTKTPVD